MDTSAANSATGVVELVLSVPERWANYILLCAGIIRLFYYQKLHAESGVFLKFIVYTSPCAIMLSATFLKPAIFAPAM
jgi:hypothetical protein